MDAIGLIGLIGVVGLCIHLIRPQKISAGVS